MRGRKSFTDIVVNVGQAKQTINLNAWLLIKTQHWDFATATPYTFSRNADYERRSWLNAVIGPNYYVPRMRLAPNLLE